MTPILRWLRCRLGLHEGRVDGGFRCAFCPFEIPYQHDDALIEQWLATALKERS